ncbi:hypothetical protein H0H81_004912, partial [Sphagnurus paluster]
MPGRKSKSASAKPPAPKPPAVKPPAAKPPPAKAASVPSSNNKTTTHSVRGPPNPPAANNRPHPSAAK